MPLSNYRDVDIIINGEKMTIGGFARPGNDVSAFASLKNQHGIGAVISLTDNYQQSFTAAGLDSRFYTYGKAVEVYDWYDTPLELTKPIPATVYDNVYESVISAQQNGNKVAIHCGAGDGRTGTALSTLKLRELLEEAYAKNNANFNTSQNKTEKIHVHHGALKTGKACDCDVTPLVKQAIEYVRQYDNQGHQSVESPNDVRALLEYEQHLRNQLVQKAGEAQKKENLALLKRKIDYIMQMNPEIKSLKEHQAIVEKLEKYQIECLNTPGGGQNNLKIKIEKPIPGLVKLDSLNSLEIQLNYMKNMLAEFTSTPTHKAIVKELEKFKIECLRTPEEGQNNLRSRIKQYEKEYPVMLNEAIRASRTTPVQQNNLTVTQHITTEKPAVQQKKETFGKRFSLIFKKSPSSLGQIPAANKDASHKADDSTPPPPNKNRPA